ncbi:MAG: polysaccharide deacetylase family protein [Chloroflexi bacterium]|nr:polysaccharide deacetylase family protein [Chloroflexota bacterium]
MPGVVRTILILVAIGAAVVVGGLAGVVPLQPLPRAAAPRAQTSSPEDELAAALTQVPAQPVQHFARPLPGALAVATFGPDEAWSAGDRAQLEAPWGTAPALTLSSVDAREASADLRTTVDLSAANLRLTFHTDSAAALQFVGLALDTEAGAFKKFFRTDLTEVGKMPGNYTVNDGWNTIAKPKRFAYSSSGSGLTAADWAHIGAIRLIIKSKPNTTASVSFVRLEVVPVPPRGLVSLTFDHGAATIASVVAPLMAQRGYRGSVFVTPAQVGRTTDRPWASIAQLQALHAAGWDIGMHSFQGHPDFTTLPLAEVRRQFVLGAAWLDTYGFASPMKLIATPNVTWNEDIVAITAQYYAACRCAGGWGVFPPEDRYLIRAVGVLQSDRPEKVLEAAKTAALYKEWLILNFHYFDEGSYDYNYSSSDFAELLDGLASLDVEVLPMSEVVARLP